MLASLAVLAVCLGAPAAAWGSEGHQIVASLAQAMLSAPARDNAARVLGQTRLDLTAASTWADTVKGQAKYSYTSVLHYVNPAAYPPSTCTYNDAVDCKDDKCVTGAIREFTNVLAKGYRRPTDDTLDAIRFLIHFVEDVHQPLHTVTRERGGNDASVSFLGKTTNLHALFDSGILRENIKQNYGSNAAYTSYLASQLRTGGMYFSSITGWSKCKRVETAFGGCAGEWAAESLRYNCDLIYVGYSSGMTISKGYQEKATKVVELRMVAASVRLATLLDEVLEGTGITSPDKVMGAFVDGSAFADADGSGSLQIQQ